MTPQVVMVTGASAGVGRATARAFAAPDVVVGLIARGPEGLAATARDVSARGGHPVVFAVDVADADGVEASAATLERDHGAIDVWVNNAMTSVFAPVWEVSAAEFRRVTEVTYLGVVNGTLAALRRMRQRDCGVIVQVGSALAYRGIPLQSAYSASKHAIQGFTESLRAELKHDGSSVRITMVQLPAMNTPQFDVVRTRLPRRPQPVPPVYQPELAADAIVAAARHPARREWWLGGSTAITILGNAIGPGLGDRYLARTGFDAQQTDQPQPERPDNLFEPLPGDRGARGDFDDIAHDHSLQWQFTRHRRALGLAAAAALVLGAAALTQSAARNR